MLAPESRTPLLDVRGLEEITQKTAEEVLERYGDDDKARAARKPNPAAAGTPLPPWVTSMVKKVVKIAQFKHHLRRTEMRREEFDEAFDSEIDACLCSKGLTKAKGRRNRKQEYALLGQGSYGSVYAIDPARCPAVAAAMRRTRKVRSSSDKRGEEQEVVVKVQVLDSKENYERWKREAKIGKRAGELGVGPAVYESFLCQRSSEPGSALGFILMQKVTGRPLYEVANSSRFGLEESQAAVEKIADLLSEKKARMHRNLILHGDLHPGNVMVVFKDKSRPFSLMSNKPISPQEVEDVLILDFGFSDAREGREHIADLFGKIENDHTDFFFVNKNDWLRREVESRLVSSGAIVGVSSKESRKHEK